MKKRNLYRLELSKDKDAVSVYRTDNNYGLQGVVFDNGIIKNIYTPHAMPNYIVKECEGMMKGVYLRPKTRGELVDALKRGAKCEVVATNEEFTSICLDGWLNFNRKYKTTPSENIGWVIYETI